jgi:signal transduction histidine kinase/ActR/RegA family two-component response regulator
LHEVLPESVAATFMARIDSVLSSGQMSVFEYQLERDGAVLNFECRLVAVSEDQTLAVVRNITESRKAAAEKLRLEEQLQRAQKMEAIGMLAGGVAHDLNNVLSGLVTYPQLMLMDLPPGSPLRERVQKIQASGEKAANIVQDLLTLARRGVSAAETVNFNTVVEDYLRSPEYENLRFHHPGFDLELALSPDLMVVSGSAFHLSKTVMNLVSNAAEAVQESGTVTIRTENRYIDRPIRGYDDVAEGDYVVLQVSDTGVGISEQDMERIFEPFYTRKAMGRSGTGLGMAVVWGTVKDHNGYVDVKSRQGEGTTISIFLPVATGTEARVEIATIDASMMGRGETVLVVDDVAEQREIAEAVLAKLGYRVTAVESGEAAVDYIRTRSVDLVVLDMVMDPGIDGLETYRRIRDIRPGQKAIITSGFSESVRVREAEALGVGAYVKKPYLMETIGPVIRAELDRR